MKKIERSNTKGFAHVFLFVLVVAVIAVVFVAGYAVVEHQANAGGTDSLGNPDAAGGVVATVTPGLACSDVSVNGGTDSSDGTIIKTYTANVQNTTTSPVDIVANASATDTASGGVMPLLSATVYTSLQPDQSMPISFNVSSPDQGIANENIGLYAMNSLGTADASGCSTTVQ